MNSNVVMIKGSQVDLWGRALKVELARCPALAKRSVRCRVMIWISMGTASVFSVLNKIPRPRQNFGNHYLPCSRENAASQTRFLWIRGGNPQKIVSFNCKTAAIQRLVTGAYGSISHECLTCPYFWGIFIAIRYLIMLGFFPRIFHILVSQLRRCFCSASPSEKTYCI